MEIVCHDDPRTSQCRVLGVKEIIHHTPVVAWRPLSATIRVLRFLLFSLLHCPSPWIFLLPSSSPVHACRGDGQEEAWRKRGSPRWPSSREFYTAQLSALVDKSLDNGLLLLLPSLPCLTFPPHGLERCRGAEDREKEEEEKEDGGEIKGDLRFGKEGFTDVNLTCAVRLRINRFEFF